MKDTTERIGQITTPDNAAQRKQEHAQEKRCGGDNGRRGGKISKRGRSPQRDRKRNNRENKRLEYRTRKIQDAQEKEDRRRQEEKGKKKGKEQADGKRLKEKDRVDSEAQQGGAHRKGWKTGTKRSSPYSEDASHRGREDWGPWDDREERLRKECGKRGETFRPEDDWGVEDRHADDRERAEANTARRQRREWAEQGRYHDGNYPEPAIAINTTRRWSVNQRRGWEGKPESARKKNISEENWRKPNKNEYVEQKDINHARTKPGKEGRQKSTKGGAGNTAIEGKKRAQIITERNDTETQNKNNAFPEHAPMSKLIFSVCFFFRKPGKCPRKSGQHELPVEF